MPDNTRKRNLKDQYYRWEVVRECRVPDTYTRNGKTIRVAGGLVKAVLLDLAKWAPEQTIFEGVESISLATQIPERTVKDALRVLVKHGLISRVERPFMAATKVTTLHWEQIESLRQRRERKLKAAEPDEESGDGSMKPEVSPLARLLVSLPHVGAKLTAKDADTLAGRLIRKHGKDPSYVAASALKDDLLSRAAANATNPVAYLAKCVDEKHDQIEASLIGFLGDVRLGKFSSARVGEDASPEYLDAFASWLTALSADEFTIGSPRLLDHLWYIDLSK